MAAGPPDVGPLLGQAKKAWDKVLQFLDEQSGVTTAWKFYGAKHGWQLKAMANKRALVYLIPRDGHFTAAVALRDPSIAALRTRGYPEARVREIEEARGSTEGKPARVEIRGPRDVPLLVPILEAKLESL